MIESLAKNRKYLVGVSGGCDSMALLDMLYNACIQVVAVHVNYFLRFDSILDELTVSSYCKERNIPFEILRVDASDYEKGNFQAQARRLRYAFYYQIGQKYQIDTIVLGHHLDDQLETIYMQKQRGFMGFLGLNDHSFVQGMEVLRPLLERNKAELRDYCHDNDVYYRDDYTNFQSDFTRDFVRNEVFNGLSCHQKEELLLYRSYYNRQKMNIINGITPLLESYRDSRHLDVRVINADNYMELLYEVLSFHLDKELITSNLINEIYKQLQSEKPNVTIKLPVNYEFIKEYHNVFVTIDKKTDDYEYVLNCPELQVSEHFVLASQGPINNGVMLEPSDYPLTIRNYKAGDKIVTSGGTKKVSRLFIDNKIPASRRKTYPVVVNAAQEIVLIPGIAKNIKYLTTKANLFVLLL